MSFPQVRQGSPEHLIQQCNVILDRPDLMEPQDKTLVETVISSLSEKVKQGRSEQWNESVDGPPGLNLQKYNAYLSYVEQTAILASQVFALKQKARAVFSSATSSLPRASGSSPFQAAVQPSQSLQAEQAALDQALAGLNKGIAFAQDALQKQPFTSSDKKDVESALQNLNARIEQLGLLSQKYSNLNELYAEKHAAVAALTGKFASLPVAQEPSIVTVSSQAEDPAFLAFEAVTDGLAALEQRAAQPRLLIVDIRGISTDLNKLKPSLEILVAKHNQDSTTATLKKQIAALFLRYEGLKKWIDATITPQAQAPTRVSGPAVQPSTRADLQKFRAIERDVRKELASLNRQIGNRDAIPVYQEAQDLLWVLLSNYQKALVTEKIVITKGSSLALREANALLIEDIERQYTKYEETIQKLSGAADRSDSPSYAPQDAVSSYVPSFSPEDGDEEDEILVVTELPPSQADEAPIDAYQELSDALTRGDNTGAAEAYERMSPAQKKKLDYQIEVRGISNLKTAKLLAQGHKTLTIQNAIKIAKKA